MKKIFLLFAIGAFLQVHEYEGYTINATFTGIDSAMVILKAQAKTDIDLNIKPDTVQMVEGKFTFQNKLTTPEAYTVTIQGTTPISFPLYLENVAFTITGDIHDVRSIVVKGGHYQTTMDSLAKVKESIATSYPSREEIERELRDSITTNGIIVARRVGDIDGFLADFLKKDRND